MLKSIQNSSVLSSVIPFPLIFLRFCVFLFLCTSFSLFFWPFLWLIMPRCLRAFVPSCLRAFVPSCLRAFVTSCLRAFVPSSIGVYWCLYAFSYSSLHPFVSSSLKAFCAYVAWSFASLILSYLLFLNYIQQLYFLWLITCCSSHLIKMCTCSV